MPDWFWKLDFSTASGWILLAFFVLWQRWDDLKRAFGKFYTDRHSNYVDQREALQDIEQAKVNFEFQDRATRAAQEVYERRAAIDIISDQLHHSREDISALQRESTNQTRRLDLIEQRLTIIAGDIARIHDDARFIRHKLDQ